MPEKKPLPYCHSREFLKDKTIKYIDETRFMVEITCLVCSKKILAIPSRSTIQITCGRVCANTYKSLINNGYERTKCPECGEIVLAHPKHKGNITCKNHRHI